MYRITVDNVETYMVVIRNAFSSNIKIHKKYDLKGSTVDREASQKEREKDEPTYKDNDFLHDKCKIHIGEDAKAKLMDTLGKSRIIPSSPSSMNVVIKRKRFSNDLIQSQISRASPFLPGPDCSTPSITFNMECYTFLT